MDFTIQGKNWTTEWASRVDDIKLGYYMPSMDIFVKAKTQADEIEGLIGFFIRISLSKDKENWETESLRKLVQSLTLDHVEQHIKEVRKTREEQEKMRKFKAGANNLFATIAAKIGVEVKDR